MKRQSPAMNESKKLFALLAALLALSSGLVLFPSAPTYAAPKATITVNSNLDSTGTCSATGSGTCTMRDAISYANSNAGADTINVGVSGIITLSSLLPAVADTLTINGNNVTLNGNDATQILSVNLSVAVTLTNLILNKGRTSGDGGAILNNGTLSISNSSFISNTSTAAKGGAIQNFGTLTVTNSNFSLNRSYAFGGAIDNDPPASLLIVNSTFTNNATMNGAGGGAIDSDAPLIIIGSIFTNNSSAGSHGGAVWIFDTATIGNSLFMNNTATGTGEGGAIQFASGSSGVITSSSFVGNTAENGGAISIATSGAVAITNTTVSGNFANADGGGIAFSSANATVNNVTINGNVADNNGDGSGDGGGVKVASGSLNFKNTIIANNVDNGAQAPDCSGTLTSQDYNLIRNSTGCTIGGTTGNNKTGDPKLGPLGYYGGSTLVHSLLTGSPALNFGNNATCAATDQRGVARPIAVICDMGAYEGIGYGLYFPLVFR